MSILIRESIEQINRKCRSIRSRNRRIENLGSGLLFYQRVICILHFIRESQP